MRSTPLVLAVLGALLTPTAIRAQVPGVPGGSSRVSVQAAFEPARAAAGASIQLVVTVDVEPGWHIYSVKKAEFQEPTTFGLDGADVRISGDVVEPEPHVEKNDWGDSTYHTGRVAFRLPVTVAAGLEGIRTVRGVMNYMACDESGCEPPTSIAFKAELEIGAAQTAPTAETGGGGAATAALLEAIKRLESRMKGDKEDADRQIAALTASLQKLLPPEPPAPAEAPAWEIEDARISVIDSEVRAGEKARLRLTFSTADAVHLDSAADVFADFGSSDRVKEVEAVEASSSEDGRSHVVLLELLAKPLARSGRESIDLNVSLPLSQEGNAFEKEVKGLGFTMDFGLPSLWSWILKATVAALLALLTPCVFPMIPVTVSFFTKQADQQHRNPLVLPVVYIFGIVVSFVAIGTLVTLAFSADSVQQMATNGYLQGFFGVLFVVFAISLFGVFTLRPPSFLMAKAGAVQGKGGVGGTLGMGLLFSLTSFTCTAPLVGAMLVDAATSGEWAMPIVGMTVFATVLALPFFVLSLFPRMVKTLPKSGGWLNSVKVTLGFLELAFALKFIGAADAYFGLGIFTRPVILWIWVVLFILNGVYLLGWVRFAHDAKLDRVGPIGGSLAIVLVVFGAYLMNGALGRPMPYLVESLMPPSLEEVAGSGSFGWDNHMKDDPEGAISRAKASGKGVLIDFTGYT